MEVPARRDAHLLDLQGWRRLDLFWIWDLTQNWSERVAKSGWFYWIWWIIMNNLEGIGVLEWPRVAQSGTELLELQADSCFPPPLTSLGRGISFFKWRGPLMRMLKAPTSCPLSSKPCILQRDGGNCGLSHYLLVGDHAMAMTISHISATSCRISLSLSLSKPA